jgi:hypothetical protein
MCDQRTRCEKPDELAGKPEKCSPEQVRKCHGDVKEHPCVAKPEQDD